MNARTITRILRKAKRLRPSQSVPIAAWSTMQLLLCFLIGEAYGTPLAARTDAVVDAIEREGVRAYLLSMATVL